MAVTKDLRDSSLGFRTWPPLEWSDNFLHSFKIVSPIFFGTTYRLFHACTVFVELIELYSWRKSCCKIHRKIHFLCLVKSQQHCQLSQYNWFPLPPTPSSFILCMNKSSLSSLEIKNFLLSLSLNSSRSHISKAGIWIKGRFMTSAPVPVGRTRWSGPAFSLRSHNNSFVSRALVGTEQRGEAEQRTHGCPSPTNYSPAIADFSSFRLNTDLLLNLFHNSLFL